ncbi:MAG: hypothetical protein DHS20C13_11100 [Thermodesulfobacteriota bacterium]|nr:MAG: hypothetical protein DHS20C13_11100 [Thermodesulfobacteriota bacterium]
MKGLFSLIRQISGFSFNMSIMILTIALFVSYSIVSANAVIFNVDSTLDAIDTNPGDGICDNGIGLCTLRAAIMESNVLEGPDEIMLDATTYTLTIAGGDDFAANGDLDIRDDLIIQGQGAMDTAIDGNELSRVFHLIGGTMRNQIVVEIFDLKIIDADVGNQGGGIRNSSGNLLIERVLLESNTAPRGGGLYNGPLANTTIRSCAIYDNFATDDPNEWGGGIYNLGEMLIINSTISNNAAGDLGAGIFNEGQLNITFTTIASNITGSEQTAGIHQTLGSSATISSSIIADNIGGDCGGILVTSQGFNISTSGCNLNQPTDMPNTDPIMDFLQDGGGDTFTHPLLNGSPAIDMAGSDFNCFIHGFDQRGSIRPRDGDLDKDLECDAGAYEFNPEVDSGESTGEGCSLVAKNSVTTLPLYMLIPALMVLALGFRKKQSIS